MRVEPGIGGIVVALAVLASASAAAFEPGTRRVCTPSADGQRFECHDKDAGDAPLTPAPVATTPPATPAVTSAPNAPATTPLDTAAPRSTPAAPPTPPARTSSGTRALPNYLLQSPARGTPPAEPVATEAARDVAAKPAVREPDAAPVATRSAPAAARTDADARAADARAPERASATAEPARVEPVAPRQRAEAPVVAAAPPAAPATSARVNADGAAEFRRLSPSRFTVELAKAQQPGAFSALIAALGDVDGTLYVIGLSAPGQRTWHLLWSDFDTIETARAARAGLPANVAITSGWPRRIGPLQAELDAP